MAIGKKINGGGWLSIISIVWQAVWAVLQILFVQDDPPMPRNGQQKILPAPVVK